MSTDAVSEKKGLLHELKDGFSIDLTEEEYLAKEAEIRKIADKLTINMDVLNLLEKDYKLRLLVLSITSYFGFREVTGEELLDAANLQQRLSCPVQRGHGHVLCGCRVLHGYV